MSKESSSTSIDVMLDLETTGTQAGCGILSIGACSFDLSYNFYDRINPISNQYGLKDSPSTIAWWNRQSPIARMEAFGGTKHLVEVLGAFGGFLAFMERTTNKEIFLWGNGADFDLPILQAAYDAVGMKQPWKPFNGRCYRTLKNLYRDVKADEFEGTKHNALADAQHQARHAIKILRVRKEQNRQGELPGFEEGY